MDYAVLANELNTDPQTLGYAPFISSGNNTVLRRLLNTPGQSGESIERDTIPVEWVRDQLVFTEVAALTTAERETLTVLLSGNHLTVNPRTKAAFSQIFGAGTTTRANLVALLNRPASRAEVLFGSGVTVGQRDLWKARKLL